MRKIDVPLAFALAATSVVVIAILITAPISAERLDSVAFWIALFTLALTVSTILLWRETRRLAERADDQARKMEQSIELARKEFLATHRPKIAVRRVEPIFASGEPLEIRFGVINKGESVARSIRWKAATYLLNNIGAIHGIPSLPGKAHSYDQSLDVGQGQTFSVKEAVPFHGPDMISIENGERILHVLGYVQYKDDTGTDRVTGFFRYYDPSQRRFHAVNDPDYEYRD
jgi:hypothetical protein